MTDRGAETMFGGWCAPEFAAVRDAFIDNFERHGELGASVCIYVEGAEALHLWGGASGAGRSAPWCRDTLIAPASSVKGMFSFCVHKLVSDGRLGYDDPVIEHWPEFGANGKADTTVRQLLGQTDGLEATFPIDVYHTPLAEILPVIEAARPATPPGAHGAYHSQTLMPLLAALLFKATGEEIHRYFRREIAGPWGIDAYLTLPPSEFRRAGDTVIAAGTYYHRLMSRLKPDSATGQDIILAPESLHLWPYATARAYARLWGGLVNDGTLDGLRLFTPSIVAAANEVQWTNDSWYPFPGNATYAGKSQSGTLGFFRAQGAFPMGPNPRAFGFPGAGGNLALADPDRRLGFGYVLNSWHPGEDSGPRVAALVEAPYRAF